MNRAIGIEEPWTESAFYLSSARDNDPGPGYSWNVGAEWDLALSPRWGVEVDFPGVLMTVPIGRAPSTLAPVTVGLKAVPWQEGSADTANAGVLGLEVEGSYWHHPLPQDFPGAGSSLAAQILLGLRRHRVFLQGEYGWGQHLSADARSGWFADTALGYAFARRWAGQMEVDLNHLGVQADGATSLEGSLVPQIDWHASDRLHLALGESFTHVTGQEGVDSATDLLLEYSFYDDH